MKKLKINITNARIESFSVELKDNEPVVSVSIGLYTDGGKKITDYSISSRHWQEENEFELPVDIIQPIMQTAKVLERVAVSHCQNSQVLLN